MHRFVALLAPLGLAAALSVACAAPAPVLLNADFAGETFGFLAGNVPAGFAPRVVGEPAAPPLFGRSGSNEATIDLPSPCVASLDQPLHAGFGSALRFRVPVRVAGEGVCRIGLLRREAPEDADWSGPAGSGETLLELSTRGARPGALFRVEFACATGPAALLVRRIEATVEE